MPLADAWSTPPIEDDAALGAAAPPAAQPVSFFDKVKLGYDQAGAGPDWGLNQMRWRQDAKDEIRAALKTKGLTPIDPSTTTAGQVPMLRGERPDQWTERLWRMLFDQVQEVRESADPNFLPEFAAVTDRNSFQQAIRNRRSAELADIEQRAPDGLGLAGFIGAIGHGFTDPTSFIPVGGQATTAATIGRAILGTAAREAGANMAFTLATEPLVRVDARSMGIERTLGDTAFDVTVAGAAGGVIGAAASGAAPTARLIGDTLFPNAVRRMDADAFGKALEAQIARTDIPDGPLKSFDASVARAFAETVPPDKRTADEQAAIGAIERDAEVKATSPFVEGPHGDDEHVKWLDLAMQSMTRDAADAPPMARPGVKPIARETLAAGGDAAATRMPAREAVKARIHRAETSPGDDFNEASGAMGPYQFMPRTWVSLFKRRYPKDMRGFDQIAALRRDPFLNGVLMNDLMSENGAALRHAGFEESAGNLYLAHVLGHDRAVTVLRADPNARLGDLLPHNYFAHNPFKAGDSAASLVHWAYGRVGDRGIPAHVATAAPEAAQAAAAYPEADIPTGRFDVEALYGDIGMTDRPVLRPGMFGSPEEHAAAQVRFERERDMAENYAPVTSRAEAFDPYVHADAVRTYQGKVTTEAMAEALGLSPGEVRRVVGSMQAIDPNSPFMLTKGRAPQYDKLGNVTKEGTEAGRVIRRPKAPDTGPQSLLEFFAERGGLKDTGGELRAMDAQEWHKGKPFRAKLIREDGQQLDDAFAAAIEAGYFPQHRLDADADALPDTADLLEAIDEELRGNLRYRPDALGDVEQRKRALYGDEPEPETIEALAERMRPALGYDVDAMVEAAKRRGLSLHEDAILEDAAALMEIGHGADEALDHAMLASAYRGLDEAAAETGNSTYAISPEERFAGDDGFPERRGAGPDDLEGDGGFGGSEGVAEAQTEARARLAQLADDPARAEFTDPVGPAAEAQADSLTHDLEMARRAAAVDIRFDNPGGEWLERKRQYAEEDFKPTRPVSGPITAYTKEKVLLDPAFVSSLPGARGERRVPGEHQYDRLAADVAARGYNDEGAVLVGVNHRGDPYVIEGNTRAAVARDRGVAAIPAEVRWFAGGETIDGPLTPAKLKEIAQPISDGAPESPQTYRLDEEGGESDLASILDEIEQAQKAVTEMRNCLKPKGGGE